MTKYLILAVAILFLEVGYASGSVAGFNASIDGYAYRTADNMTIAQASAGAGTGASTTGTTMYTSLYTLVGTTSPNFHGGVKIIWSADTSSIPDTAVITDARFNYTIFQNFSTMKPYYMTITNGSTATDGAIIAGDYNRNGTTEYVSRVIWSDTNLASGTTQRSVSFNAAGLSGINKTGYTTLFIQIADLHDSYFSGTWGADPVVGSNNTLYMRSNDHTTAAYRPVLNITYYVPTPAPSATAIFSDWPWCADQDIFFRNDPSDIDGYFHMDHRPQVEDTRYLSTAVSSSTGSKQIGAWATNASKPGVSVIGPGLWRFRVYLNVSSAVGNTNYEFKVFNRSSDGTETDLFYGHVISKDINDLTPTEHLISYARRNYTQLFSGDRLVIKVNASTSSVAARDAWISLAGNTEASMVGVSYFICENGQAYQLQEAPVSPVVPLLATAMGILLIGFRRGKKE